MRPTGRHPRLSFLLWPASVWVFALLAMLWGLAWILVPLDTWLPLGGLTRLCGYLATLALAIPYLHILRRSFRHRSLGQMTTWLWWHIAGAYAAFFLVLVHSRAQANAHAHAVVGGVVVGGDGIGGSRVPRPKTSVSPADPAGPARIWHRAHRVAAPPIPSHGSRSVCRTCWCAAGTRSFQSCWIRMIRSAPCCGRG